MGNRDLRWVPGTLVDVVRARDGVRQELHGEVAQLLATRGQRYTAQRRQIVGALADIGRPATIGDLVAVADRVPVSTAYRNLTVMGDANVVRRVGGPDGFARFELSEELSGHHHHHVVCESCGLVSDAAASPDLEAALAATARAIARANGFDVTEHRLELVGRCTQCRSSAS